MHALAHTTFKLTLAGKLGFIVGWLFFALTFLLAAVESIKGSGFITPAHELMLTLAPGKWIAFKSNFNPDLISFLNQTVLQLPAWLLTAIPAGTLLWTCRPHREEVDPDLYESLTTYDRLAKLAKEEGALDDDPTYQEYLLEDYEDDQTPDDLKPASEYMKEWMLPEHHDEPQIEGPNKKLEEARGKMTIPFDKLS